MSDLEDSQDGSYSDRRELISSDNNNKISVTSVINNILFLIFFIYITYISFQDGVSLYSFHPMLCTLGLLLMTRAVNSLHSGGLLTKWIPALSRTRKHWIFQLLSFICIISGFIVIVVNKIINNKSHFSSIHSVTGLCAIVMICLTSSGGIVTLHSLKFIRLITPSTLKILHSLGGLISFTLGIVTLFFGFYSEWEYINEPFKTNGTLILITVLILTLFRPSINLFMRIKNKFCS